MSLPASQRPPRPAKIDFEAFVPSDIPVVAYMAPFFV